MGTNIVKANEGSSTDSALAKAKAAFGVRGGDLSSYLDKQKSLQKPQRKL